MKGWMAGLGLAALVVLQGPAAEEAQARGGTFEEVRALAAFADVEEVNAVGRPKGRAADCVKDSEELDVRMHPQGMGNWCWLASAQMILETLGVQDFAQCAQVNTEKNRGRQRGGKPQCCMISGSDFLEFQRCNSTGWPDRSFRDRGIAYDTTAGRDRDNANLHRPGRVLNWESIQEQLSSGGGRCKGQPFAFSWRYGGGGGHMMVASGYMTTSSGTRKIRVHDPVHSGGKKFWIDYEYFKESAGGEKRKRRSRRRGRRSRSPREPTYHHVHWDDYYNFRRNDGGQP